MPRKLVVCGLFVFLAGSCSDSSPPGGSGDGSSDGPATDAAGESDSSAESDTIRIPDDGGAQADGSGDGAASDGGSQSDGSQSDGSQSDGSQSDGSIGGVWQVVSAPVKAGACCLEAVWGSASTDVWAVGNNQILHYDGTAWMPTVLPPAGQFHHQFTSVAGTSSGQVYAGGYQQVAQFVPPGSGWKLMPDAPIGVHALWVDALDGLWGVRTDSSTLSAFARYDGVTWTETTLAGNYLAIWGASSTDVWAVSLDGTIAHSHGAEFTEMTSPASQKDKLYAVWGASSTDVWAGGEQQYSAASGGNGLLRHFNGTSWTQAIAFTPPFTVRGIWGTSSNNVWAVGDANMILHYDGATWSAVAVPSGGTGAFDLRAIWGSAPDDIWAVGGGSLTGASPEGLILHFH